MIIEISFVIVTHLSTGRMGRIMKYNIEIDGAKIASRGGVLFNDELKKASAFIDFFVIDQTAKMQDVWMMMWLLELDNILKAFKSNAKG